MGELRFREVDWLLKIWTSKKSRFAHRFAWPLATVANMCLRRGQQIRGVCLRFSRWCCHRPEKKTLEEGKGCSGSRFGGAVCCGEEGVVAGSGLRLWWQERTQTGGRRQGQATGLKACPSDSHFPVARLHFPRAPNLLSWCHPLKHGCLNTGGHGGRFTVNPQQMGTACST